MRDVTDQTFAADVLGAERPVVVDFWAPWCGPCHAIAPILGGLAEEYAGRIDFVKLNIDENYATASRYGVLSIPTTILFEGGEPRETVLGARPRSHFERAFAPWLAAAGGVRVAPEVSAGRFRRIGGRAADPEGGTASGASS